MTDDIEITAVHSGNIDRYKKRNENSLGREKKICTLPMSLIMKYGVSSAMPFINIFDKRIANSTRLFFVRV